MARSDEAQNSELSPVLAADAQALREATAEVPGIDDTARALRLALAAQAEAEPPLRQTPWSSASLPETPATGRPEPTGGFMKTLYPLSTRPKMFTAVLTGGFLAAVLFWPVSYERTVGHTVTLAVPADPNKAGDPGAARERVRSVAERLKRAVGAGAVRVTASGPDAPLVLTARVPSRSRKDLERQLAGLTAALHAEHLEVTSSIVARTERHTGRVYAMALDKLIDIRVDTTGKSDSQVETEIRDQLTRSGMTPDAVQFQRTGDESEASIQAHDGDHELHVVRRQKGDHGELHIEAGGLDTERTPGMTDDQLRDKIERQLIARGLTPTVTVHGDQIQIRAEKRLTTP